MNGRWYYLNADGDMAIGWILVNGVWYYLNPMAGVLDPGGKSDTGGRNVRKCCDAGWLSCRSIRGADRKITDSGRYLKRYLPLFLLCFIQIR